LIRKPGVAGADAGAGITPFLGANNGRSANVSGGGKRKGALFFGSGCGESTAERLGAEWRICERGFETILGGIRGFQPPSVKEDGRSIFHRVE
jgi:hypothetical protein